jgi:aminopeptidase N
MSKHRLIAITVIFLALNLTLHAQEPKTNYTHADTLRGSIGPERSFWDVQRYDLSVQPDYATFTIRGCSMITVKWTGSGETMQLDLQEPLQMDSVLSPEGKAYSFTKEGNAWHVHIGADRPSNVRAYYHGLPRIAVRPPWDGGWIFTRDKLGRPWMSVACQGLGASVWYPCKDHQSDEPDLGASLSMTVPDTLVAVANGRLAGKTPLPGGLTTWRWEVKDPINNYNIIPYIGKYVNWSDTYPGEKGALDCSYWVLDYNLEKARAQFTQAHDMLQCFEHWFGPYPFYEDGYKLVEAPHLGMEHQSAVAYGNGYANGYRGTDLSGTGWGLKWDFIIVHESGHEWFGNNITSNDLADMWVHEGFTNYSETLFTTCKFGVEAGNAYVQGTRKRIANKQTIITAYGVNAEGSGDMYYKGGNLIHYVRQVVGDDEKFRLGLREINKRWYHATVNSSDIEAFWSIWSGKDLSSLFDQYLRHTEIPVLEYELKGKKLRYRWTNCITTFKAPVKVSLDGKAAQWINPKSGWTTKKLAQPASTLETDPNFYVGAKKLGA